MENITFSIIIPTFNCEKLIKQTLDSIVIQESKLYECIVVDGLSQDNTIDIVREYEKQYDNIKHISEKDNGIYDAMNKGIGLAKGKYLYFIGSGDKLYKDILVNINEKMNDEDFIYGNAYFVYENVNKGEEVRKSDLIYELLCHQAIFYKNNVFDLHGRYELKYKIGADNIFNKKIFADDRLSKKYIDIDIAHYLGGGVSQDYNIISEFEDENNFIDELIKIFNKDYLKQIYENVHNIKNKRLIAWGNGGEYIKASSFKDFGVDYFVKSYVDVNETFESKPVKCREALLGEQNEEIFILVYSAHYYREIRRWLEDNNFVEFKDFILITKEILMLLNKLNLL